METLKFVKQEALGIVVALLILVLLLTGILSVYQGTKAEATIKEEFGKTAVIESSKSLGNLFSDRRYLITTSSESKIVDKGYWVVVPKNGKTIKSKQEIKQEELATILRIKNN